MVFVLGNITFDSADPPRLAEFWSRATGWPITDARPYLARVAPADGGRPHLLFLKVSEPKSVKNRMHLDFGTGDLEAELTRLEVLGAARHESHHEHGFTWTVMTDPEGNEFCVGRPE